MLTNEEKDCAQIAQELSDAFTGMSDGISAAVELVQQVDWDSGRYPQPLDRWAAFQIRGHLISLLKKHRGTQLLCQGALAENGEMLVRSMFETTVWLFFMLVQDLELKADGTTHTLDCNMRARIYWAHSLKQQRRLSVQARPDGHVRQRGGPVEILQPCPR